MLPGRSRVNQPFRAQDSDDRSVQHQKLLTSPLIKDPIDELLVFVFLPFGVQLHLKPQRILLVELISSVLGIETNSAV
jgi:hypothetical protein